VSKASIGKSKRWHFTYAGRTFILYAEHWTAAHDAAHKHVHTLGLTDHIESLHVRPSGHYDYATNTIVGAMDGDIVLQDWK
jgi:hypothetical protein